MIAAEDLSIVIPFRHDRAERLENLTAVLRHLTATLAGAEIIVIENGPARADDQPLPALPGLRHIRQITEAPFHRTRLLNQGIEHLATRRFAASYDTDALIYPAAWAQALTLLRQGAPLVFPYGGRFCDARGSLRAQLLARPDLALPGADQAQAAPSKGRGDLICLHSNSVGGVVLFDRATYSACGGYHEGFVGWGFEDAEIVERFARLGHTARRVADLALIHLSHPRGRGWSSAGWYGASRRNHGLYRAMARLSGPQLAALVASGGLRGTPKPQTGRGWLGSLRRLWG